MSRDIFDYSFDAGHAKTTRTPKKRENEEVSEEGVYVTLKTSEKSKSPDTMLEIDDTDYARAKRQVTERLNK